MVSCKIFWFFDVSTPLTSYPLLVKFQLVHVKVLASAVKREAELLKRFSVKVPEIVTVVEVPFSVKFVVEVVWENKAPELVPKLLLNTVVPVNVNELKIDEL